jgi:putative aldouronate transport system substrate-binding protein
MGTATPMVEGRIPGGAAGVPDAWTKLPPVYKSVAMIPGRGGTVTSFHIAYQPPPPPRSENRYWQELEKRLGVTLEPAFGPAGEPYRQRLAALTASGSLPDLTFANGGEHLRVIQQGAYTELTPYLTGDALQEYPNLARFPDICWKNARINGKLYGVPRPRYQAANPLHWRLDWAEKLGAPEPKNADEFASLMIAMTGKDPDGNGRQDTYGLGSISVQHFNLSFFLSMFRAPNGWRLDGGKLTGGIETAEFKAAVAYMRQLWEVGAYHPDSATLSRQDAEAQFVGGKIGGLVIGIEGVPGPRGMRASTQQVAPAAKVRGLVPFGHDGGNAVTYNGPGYFGFTAIPAKVGKDKERTKELLGILNYLAAPFGSEEQIFLDSGLEGVHHTVKPDGSRVTNDLLKEKSELRNLITVTLDFYYPETPGDAEERQSLVRDIQAIGIENPVVALFSPTEIDKGGELGQLQTDWITRLVTGREPMSAFDQYVKEWRSRGGDQIRKEYEEALKNQ